MRQLAGKGSHVAYSMKSMMAPTSTLAAHLMTTLNLRDLAESSIIASTCKCMDTDQQPVRQYAIVCPFDCRAEQTRVQLSKVPLASRCSKLRILPGNKQHTTLQLLTSCSCQDKCICYSTS